MLLVPIAVLLSLFGGLVTANPVFLQCPSGQLVLTRLLLLHPEGSLESTAPWVYAGESMSEG